MRTIIALAVLVAAGITCGQAPPEPYPDPAPPRVAELPAVVTPEAAVHPGLVFRAPPAPLAPGAVTADWPGFLGPNRDGHCRETPLAKTWPDGGPPLVWSVTTGSGFAAPVVAGRRVVLTHRVGDALHVDCLEAETGRRYWRHSTPCDYKPRYIRDDGPRSTPLIDGDRVYVHGVQGTLACLELATGRVIWRRDLAGEFAVPDGFFGVVSSPLAHDGRLIQNLGAPGGPGVAAFDLRTGRLAWGCGETWGASCASPVVAVVGGRATLFVLAGGESRPPTGGLMIVDPAGGEVLHTYPFRSRTYESVNGASPVIGGDRVFVTASYSTGTAAIDLAAERRFEEAWRTKRIGIEFSTPIFEGGHLYLVDGRSDRAGAIVCLDPATGEEASRTDLDWEEAVVYGGRERTLSLSIGNGSLLHADGALLCLGDNGHLLWLEAGPSGTRVLARSWLFRASQSWTPPVVSRGLLYVRQNRPERFGTEPAPPRLLCYDLRGGRQER